MKSLTLLLLVTVAAFAGEDEPCHTPIESYQPSVESMLKMPEGMSVSWLDKYVGRLGDAAAVVLIRLGAPQNLKNPTDIRKALHILSLAFDCPSCIERDEDRTTGVTMLLLSTMEATTQGTQLREQISQTRDRIRNQVSQYTSGAKLLTETTIAVKSASMKGNVVLVDAEMSGNPLQLECFVSQAYCRVPKPGGYLVFRLPAGGGTYTDCQNVDLYERSADSQTTKLFGEYCVLGVF